MKNDLPSREPMKRGRPKESNNKKKTNMQRQLEVVAANDNFEIVFQTVQAIKNGEIKERTDNVN